MPIRAYNVRRRMTPWTFGGTTHRPFEDHAGDIDTINERLAAESARPSPNLKTIQSLIKRREALSRKATAPLSSKRKRNTGISKSARVAGAPPGYTWDTVGTGFKKKYKTVASANAALAKLEQQGWRGLVNQIGGHILVRLRADSHMEENPGKNKRRERRAVARFSTQEGLYRSKPGMSYARRRYKAISSIERGRTMKRPSEQKYLTRRNTPGGIDQPAVRELELFIDNTGSLHTQQFTPILKNLAAKKARGIYKHAGAVKLFRYLVDKADKMYFAGVDSPWKAEGKRVTTSTATRNQVAENYAHAFEQEYDSGNYRDLLPKKYQSKSNPKSEYEVIVGNIGSVYSGGSKAAALKKYNTYVKQSKTGSGRAGGEQVTLMQDGEPIKEHYGSGGEYENPRRRRARNPKLEPITAHQILSSSGAPIGGGFHSLPSRVVDALLSHAPQYKYRRPANALGSKGRYWHDYLQRVAARSTRRNTRNPKSKYPSFASLPIGAKFEFSSVEEFPLSGMARGPWIKTSARGYRIADGSNNYKYKVGAIKTGVIQQQNPRSPYSYAAKSRGMKDYTIRLAGLELTIRATTRQAAMNEAKRYVKRSPFPKRAA